MLFSRACLPREEVTKVKAFGLLSSFRSSRSYLLGLFVFLSLLTLSACGGVNSVGIYDNARVLNASQVKNAASKLPNNVDIYTVNDFSGTQADFQRATSAKLRGDPNRIVMAIDTTNHYTYVARGTKVPLSGAGISQAVSSFSSNYNNGDYTGATVAALGSMNSVLATHRGPSFSPVLFACLPLLLVGFLLFMMKARRPGAYGFPRGFGAQRGPYQPPLQPGSPYDQGGYGPGQQGGYGQQGYGPPQQRGGMNPWAAGGLGAAAGGLAGYELGKMQGEHRNEGGGFGQDGGDSGGGGNFGGGGSFGSDTSGGGGNFGGDNSGGSNFSSGGADYGNDDFGGGGNFGGGGGDSGGGGSFGSGGGDFGGGSSDSGGGGNF